MSQDNDRDVRQDATNDAQVETNHLLRHPANAAHLLRSIAQADAGHLVEHDLTEPSGQ